jgi:hypothetical protein
MGAMRHPADTLISQRRMGWRLLGWIRSDAGWWRSSASRASGDPFS